MEGSHDRARDEEIRVHRRRRLGAEHGKGANLPARLAVACPSRRGRRLAAGEVELPDEVAERVDGASPRVGGQTQAEGSPARRDQVRMTRIVGSGGGKVKMTRWIGYSEGTLCAP